MAIRATIQTKTEVVKTVTNELIAAAYTVSIMVPPLTSAEIFKTIE